MYGVFSAPQSKKTLGEKPAASVGQGCRVDRNDPHLLKCMELIYKNISKRF